MENNRNQKTVCWPDLPDDLTAKELAQLIGLWVTADEGAYARLPERIRKCFKDYHPHMAVTG